MRIKASFLFFLLFVLLILSPSVFAKENFPLSEKLNNDKIINWDEKTVTAGGKADFPQGISSPAQALLMAKKAALADAKLKLRETIGTIRFTEKIALNDLLTQNNILDAKMDAVLKDFKIINEKRTDNSYQVTIGMNFWGETGFSPLLFPFYSKEFSLPKGTISEVKPMATEYSGLIIDAQGAGFKPMVFPHIIDEKGNYVYGAITKEDEFIFNQGTCDYSSSVEEALRFIRVGAKPLIIKAKALNDKEEIILSINDANLVRAADLTSKILENYRVVIVP